MISDKYYAMMFSWFELIMYLDPVSKFQYSETTERPGYFVGFVDNLGDTLTFMILKNDLVTVLHKSVVTPAEDANNRNRRVSFKSNVQESLKLLDTNPSFTFFWKDSHHDYKSRNSNSAKTYIQNVIPKFEGLFSKEFKPIKIPMSEVYHPEVDDSSLCTEDDSANYRLKVICCIWIIVLDRFDISNAPSTMSRFNMITREGHLRVVERTLSYLKTFPKGRVIIYTSYPDHSVYPVEDHSK
jgi:hypothetical protein